MHLGQRLVFQHPTHGSAICGEGISRITVASHRAVNGGQMTMSTSFSRASPRLIPFRHSSTSATGLFIPVAGNEEPPFRFHSPESAGFSVYAAPPGNSL